MSTKVHKSADVRNEGGRRGAFMKQRVNADSRASPDSHTKKWAREYIFFGKNLRLLPFSFTSWTVQISGKSGKLLRFLSPFLGYAFSTILNY